MKKNLYFTFLALVVALVATSCTPEQAVSYPDDLTGYWEASIGSMDTWYGLDITDATNAVFITYSSQDDPAKQAMSVIYDATTGKGRLSGDGKLLQMRATSDSTLAINMVEGTAVFYRCERPKPTTNMIGFWKSNRVDDLGMDVIVFPKNAKGVNPVTVIDVDEFQEISVGTMGILESFDAETGNGVISVYGEPIAISVNTTSSPLTFQFADDDTYTFAKQPKVSNMPHSLVGQWNSNSLSVNTINITVKEDNTCTMYYKVIDLETADIKSGTVTGDIYYCQYAGMGTVVPHNLHEHPELANIIGVNACGIFNVTSATSVKVTFMGYTFEFIKQ